MHPHSLWWRAVRIGLAIQTVLAVAAFALKRFGDCGSCGRTGGAWVALAGAVAYAGLFAWDALRGQKRLLFLAILAAFVVHTRLAIAMATSSAWCIPCALAALVSAALFVAALACDRANFKRAAILLPAGAIALSILEGAVGASQRAVVRAESRVALSTTHRNAEVRLVVFEDANCPHCQALERDVLPAIEREYTSRPGSMTPGSVTLAVVRRSAVGLPGLALPTIVVAGPGGEEVIEGLPTVDMLRATIERVGVRETSDVGRGTADRRPATGDGRR